ncbi:MAG TPA: DUF47 family protein [Methanoregulaceae archaeon]|nr:MAG: DUF47 family protein [Methanolinea sp.]HON82388.1 DUF47 family protein [Methanoregulaceae archaeon]HPD10093.1 DUF47 family protein [Methanoregulaceae archaeon]HRT15099.1 DUF47 family protein [Methanoregulaceae archaeon]HRU30670.1 DUF47 family protein [Methanoregulaceae archaeon]
MMQRDQQSGKRKGLFNAIFPAEYDFEGMLAHQAERTFLGVRIFVAWLEKTPLSEPATLRQIEGEVDELRYRLEENLLDAFSTPFDRQDIYSLSRQMDYILNFSRETATEMFSFGVEPDEYIRKMAAELLAGTEKVCKAIRIMSSDRIQVEQMIREARKSMRAIEADYIAGMQVLFNAGDPMIALRKREVYHHLRDAGRALRQTVDILHKAVVGIS